MPSVIIARTMGGRIHQTCHIAQQAQPRAPQKLFRSAIGNLLDQAVA